MKPISLPLFRKLFSSQLRLNMLSGPVSTGLGFIVSAIKYPLYLHFLGYGPYGAWLLLSTVLTFAQLGLLGIGPAVGKIVAEEYGQGRHDRIQQYFISAMGMVAVIGSLLAITSFVFRSECVAILGLDGGNANLVRDLLVYMVLFSAGVMAYQVLNAVLTGVGRIDIANYSQTTLQILPLLISVPLLLAGKGVVSLLLAEILAYSVVSGLNYLRLNRLISLNILNVTDFSWQRLKTLLSFGGTIFAGSMLSMMTVPITKIVITRAIGLEIVPVFEVAHRTGMQVRSFFEVAFRALMPEISRLSSTDANPAARDRVRGIISKAYKLLFLSAPPVYIGLFVFADFIFQIWLGKEFKPNIPNAFRIILVVSSINLAGVIPYYSALGSGAVKKIFIYHSLDAGGTLFCILPLVLLAPSLFGIMGSYIIGATLGTFFLLWSQLRQASVTGSALSQGRTAINSK